MRTVVCLLGALALAPGCFLAHELDGDPSVRPPAPAPDPDPRPDPRPGPPPVCDVSDTRIEVRVVDMGGGALCALGDASGHVTAVRPEPDVDGIRISIIRGFDSFSVCEYVVSGVGADLAERISPTTLGVQGQATEDGLVLIPPTACDGCEGCSCILALPWLVAHDGPFSTEEVLGSSARVFHAGGPECSTPEALACGWGEITVGAEAYQIDVGAFDTAPILLGGVEAAEGETVEIERAGLGLRVLRANTSCTEAHELEAAWVLYGAWGTAFDATDGEATDR